MENQKICRQAWIWLHCDAVIGRACQKNFFQKKILTTLLTFIVHKANVSERTLEKKSCLIKFLSSLVRSSTQSIIIKLYRMPTRDGVLLNYLISIHLASTTEKHL